jgi:hypothetical protein
MAAEVQQRLTILRRDLAARESLESAAANREADGVDLSPTTPDDGADRSTPLVRKWWLWTIVGVAVIGLGVGIGVAAGGGGTPGPLGYDSNTFFVEL